MPEGDTLFRTAHTLRLALKGRVVTDFSSPLAALHNAKVTGLQIAEVEARGKNLLIFFGDGRALYTHLRMEGSWHIYKPGVPWKKPARRARVVLQTDAYLAVCFSAPVVQLLSAIEVKRHPTLSRLGPDLLRPDFSYEEAMCRLRELNHLAIGEVIMRQDALAGIGNVYKSEIFFLCRTDPFACVRNLGDQELRRIIARGRELMQQNLRGEPRTTRHALDGGRTWVYGRGGQPCRKCGTTIRTRRQGDGGRTTYWCPQCQNSRLSGPGWREAKRAREMEDEFLEEDL